MLQVRARFDEDLECVVVNAPFLRTNEDWSGGLIDPPELSCGARKVLL